MFLGPIRLIIEKLENTYPELNGITDAPIYAFSDASHMGLIKDKMRSCTGSAIFTSRPGGVERETY